MAKNGKTGGIAFVEQAPESLKDLIKGASTGVAVTLPFLVVWLSFTYPTTFKLEYMKEISLFVVWAISLGHLLPLKSLKAGKDGVHLEFMAEAVPPEKAVAKPEGAK